MVAYCLKHLLRLELGLVQFDFSFRDLFKATILDQAILSIRSVSCS